MENPFKNNLNEIEQKKKTLESLKEKLVNLIQDSVGKYDSRENWKKLTTQNAEQFSLFFKSLAGSEIGRINTFIASPKLLQFVDMKDFEEKSMKEVQNKIGEIVSKYNLK